MTVLARPLRRNILVADAWDRIWPPMGFSAPPATNVMVAPGSATDGQSSQEAKYDVYYIEPDW
ncbi:hypothetical protein M378DRAFT_155314 [Amanita muscaria Koide BX008]|uniref:Uncharacterized protein n=1 Tax=Amanita muscaria (strain Koide BX008) TaxID=946122 RepID=A0A0C2XR53_AMAMK|nr:hypothetical protein M378DRAFT_155314 [Amanita muscaria Koide BX008]